MWNAVSETIKAPMVVVVGIPHDANSSFLRGAASAPTRIREVLHAGSTNLCSESGLDLGSQKGFRDLGDLELPQPTPEAFTVISKAAGPDKDAYSGFEDTELEAVLRSHGVRRVFVGGLATDYCVLNTVKDALENRYQVYVLSDAVRAVNIHPGDGDKAIQEMTAKGAVMISAQDLT